MKKMACCLAVCLLCVAFSAQAQRKLVRYRGEIAVGYTDDLLNVRLLNGIAVGDYFSAGIGVGIDFTPSLFAATSQVPVYLNLKGHLPAGVVTPFVSCDIGAGIGVSGYLGGRSGLLCTPALGCAFGVGKGDRALFVSAGYSIRHLSGTGTRPGGTRGAVSLGLGYRF